jgi:hypothetical protein
MQHCRERTSCNRLTRSSSASTSYRTMTTSLRASWPLQQPQLGWSRAVAIAATTVQRLVQLCGLDGPKSPKSARRQLAEAGEGMMAAAKAVEAAARAISMHCQTQMHRYSWSWYQGVLTNVAVGLSYPGVESHAPRGRAIMEDLDVNSLPCLNFLL